ncbi:sulfotransferase family protein [Xanthomarina gelatinilytica]|uniref:sulfotransferase family protein n=1 Tax=Xanthomarina gelatinilytica TaxID=1137281 RepID=UPI003AA9BDB1
MIKKPNFIIAGFPKCGTTSLFAYLETHPEIFIPQRKEMNFFSYPIIKNLTGGEGDKVIVGTQVSTWEQYMSYYRSVRNEKAIGDASPSYINFPACFSYIKEKLDNPKIIILLRDPIKRSYSNYLHLYRVGREKLDFNSALLEEENRIEKKYSPMWYYKRHSTYYDKVIEAQKAFRDVLLLTQEEMNKNPGGFLKQVFEFLEVDSSFVPPNLDVMYNKGGVYKKNRITNLFLKQSKTKHFLSQNVSLIKKLKPLKDKILSSFEVAPPPLDKQSEDFLIKHFKEDVKKLHKLGVNTSNWNQNYFIE